MIVADQPRSRIVSDPEGDITSDSFHHGRQWISTASNDLSSTPNLESTRVTMKILRDEDLHASKPYAVATTPCQACG